MLLEELFKEKKEDVLIFYTKKSKHMPIEEALLETCLFYGKTPDELINDIMESSPPCPKAERFIKDSKKDFKKRYGKKWQPILYATAWKLFGDDPECKSKKNNKNKTKNKK